MRPSHQMTVCVYTTPEELRRIASRMEECYNKRDVGDSTWVWSWGNSDENLEVEVRYDQQTMEAAEKERRHNGT